MKIGILTFHRACNCGAALFGSAFLPLACVAADVVVEPTAVDNTAYCAFLNACAREGDPYALWNPLMQDHFWGGIDCMADAAFAPIRAGAGTCIKVLEAALYGRAVLATPFAVRGLDAMQRDALGLTVSERPDDYVAALAALIAEDAAARAARQDRIAAAAQTLNSFDRFAQSVREALVLV